MSWQVPPSVPLARLLSFRVLTSPLLCGLERVSAPLSRFLSVSSQVPPLFCFNVRSWKSQRLQAVDIISNILQNSWLESSAIECERHLILREQQEVDNQYEEVTFDHLHVVTYQGMRT